MFTHSYFSFFLSVALCSCARFLLLVSHSSRASASNSFSTFIVVFCSSADEACVGERSNAVTHSQSTISFKIQISWFISLCCFVSSANESEIKDFYVRHLPNLSWWIIVLRAQWIWTLSATGIGAGQGGEQWKQWAGGRGKGRERDGRKQKYVHRRGNLIGRLTRIRNRLPSLEVLRKNCQMMNWNWGTIPSPSARLGGGRQRAAEIGSSTGNKLFGFLFSVLFVAGIFGDTFYLRWHFANFSARSELMSGRRRTNCSLCWNRSSFGVSISSSACAPKTMDAARRVSNAKTAHMLYCERLLATELR